MGIRLGLMVALLWAGWGCDDGDAAGGAGDAARPVVDAAFDAAPVDRGAPSDAAVDAGHDAAVARDLALLDAAPPAIDSTPPLDGAVDARVDAAPPAPDAAAPDDAAPIDGGVPAPVYRGAAPPFELGSLATRLSTVAAGDDGAPKALRIWAPTVAGRYPVVQFQHGFLVPHGLYDPLLDRIAGHGFVVVAPQMYAADGIPLGKPTIEDETAAALELLDWLRPRLAGLAQVEVAFDHLALAGHSRGGQVAYRMALDLGDAAGAVAALDPVDQSGPLCTPGAGLTGMPLNLAMPALVLGTGQGGACAPAGCNHVQFWEATSAPVWHVVTPDNGHMDLLQDDLAACGLTCAFCPGAANREPMRRATAGVVVAMLRGALLDDAAARAWLDAPPAAPVALQVESR